MRHFSPKGLHFCRKHRNQNWFYNTFLTLFSIKSIRNKPFYHFLILICSLSENTDFLSRHYIAADDAKIKQISSCYDVVYDTEKKSIMLLYRLMIVDSEMTTIYRTESDEYEFFDSYQFMMELVAHLSAKLHRKASMKETSGVIHEEGTSCIA